MAEIKLSDAFLTPRSKQEQLDGLVDDWNSYEYTTDTQDNAFKRKFLIEAIEKLFQSEDGLIIKPLNANNSQFGNNAITFNGKAL